MEDSIIIDDFATPEDEERHILDDVQPEDLQPRNSLLTIRRLGSADDTKVGGIYLPDQSTKFDVAEIIRVGTGSADVMAPFKDVADLKAGMLVIVKTESSPQPGVRAQLTQKFRIGEEQIEFVNQHDVLAIVNTPGDSDNAQG